MKKKKLLGILMLCAFTLFQLGCDSGNDSPTACDAPTNFEIISYTQQSKVELGWIPNSEQTAWEIEYGHTGFTQGSGTVIQTTTVLTEIANLDNNIAYDFYVRSNCGSNNYSEWVGPVTNETNFVSHALMTANLIGVQYNYMVPFTWPFARKAVIMNGLFSPGLHIQGNTRPMDTSLANTREINLFIPENLLAVGTYTLDRNSDNGNPHVNLIYNDDPQNYTQAYENDNGTLTITEFNLQTRVIKGTFSFSFTLYNNQTQQETGPFQCINGTFDYSLDDNYFD
jgi:hypothetical protein